MQIPPRPWLWSLLLTLVVLLGAGCSRQSSKEKSLAKADAHHAAGAYDKAEIEYLNALKGDSANARALAQLGLICAEQGRNREAFRYLSKARELQPENFEVRAKLAVYFLALKSLPEARTEIRYILDRQPSHAEAPLLLADSAQLPQDITDTKDYLLKLSSAGSAPVLTALAGLEIHQQHLAEAEVLLQKALALDPKFSAGHVYLGTVYLANKNLKGAEESFAAAWKLAPLRSPHRLFYVRFKLQSGDVTSARRLLTELVTQTPDSLNPVMLLAEVATREKKYDEALTLSGKILEHDQLHFAALFLSARLRLAKGETEKALADLEKLKDLQPKNPEILYQIALAHLAKGDSGKAATSLTQAIGFAPNFTEAILLLAELNLKKGEALPVITALKPMVAQRPDLVSAKFMLARAFALHGEFSEAITTYRAITALSPTDPNPLLSIAQVYRHQKKYAEAATTLLQALELAPDSGPINEQLIDLDLIAGNQAGARQRAVNLKARQPDSAAARLLMAKIELADKQLPAAETELLKAIELQPTNVAAYYLLAGIYSQSQQEKKAVVQLEQVALNSPKNPSVHMRLAMLHERLKDFPAARDAYEKVLALEPKFPAALNNLAYIYAEYLNEVDRGLALALKAREIAPLDPNLADTLGWIYYKKGQYPQARTLLLESATKSPDDPVGQYHLGMVHYMMGDTDEARTALRHALQLNPAMPQKDEVSRHLTILGTDGPQSGPERRATLEKAVAEHKDDPVALTRLGEILERTGELDLAQKHLKAALAINPRNVNAALALIRVHLARHETKQALELAKITRKQAPEDPSIGHQLGRIAFQIGEFQWAASLLQESARKLSADHEVLFDQSKAEYSIGRVNEAEEIMQQIRKSHPHSSHISAIMLSLEMIALARSPSPEGSAKIEHVLKTDPAFVPALMAFAAKAEKESNPASARQAYEKALAQYPDFNPAKRNLVLLAAASEENDPKAYDLAAQAREAFPNDPVVTQAVGIIAYRKGEFSRAASLLKESINRLGENARSTYHLGMAQYRMKEAMAKNTLQRSLELGLKGVAETEARRAIADLK